MKIFRAVFAAVLMTPAIAAAECYCICENHVLGTWFRKAYSYA